jgi:F-type H+-transporting ATPase subunit delta
MNVGRVARRYASAVFGLAVERGEVDRWTGALHRIEERLGEADIAMLLENPSIPMDRKQEIVDRALPGLEQLPRNFAYVLVANGRASAIGAIVAEYERLVREHQGIAIAEVTTAVPLDDAESRSVARQLEALVGKRIVLERRVDPSILGGVVARIGDHLIDGSLAGQLAALRDQLAR